MKSELHRIQQLAGTNESYNQNDDSNMVSTDEIKQFINDFKMDSRYRESLRSPLNQIIKQYYGTINDIQAENITNIVLERITILSD